MIDRDDLLRRTDLAVLLDELSPRPPTRLGQNARWRCINPGHDDHHPSITMFTDRRGIQRWKCWSGGHGGTAIDALLVARGGTVADALAELERRAGLPHDRLHDRRSAAQTRSVEIQSPSIDREVLAYVSACERILWTPTGRPILRYLVQHRGLAPDVLEANHVGADPGPGVLRRAPGLPRGGPAAVLPALDVNGAVTYVQARYLDPPEGRSKYDNPAGRLAPNPRLSWANTAAHVRSDSIVVCEGTIDALSVAGNGFRAAAVLAATYVDDRLAQRIADSASGRSIVVCFDGDRAGRDATTILTTSLRKLEVEATTLPVPDGRDLNSVLASEPDWVLRQLAPSRSLQPSPTTHDLARGIR